MNIPTALIIYLYCINLLFMKVEYIYFQLFLILISYLILNYFLSIYLFIFLFIIFDYSLYYILIN